MNQTFPALALILLSGCNLMPAFELPTGELPTEWRNADNAEPQSAIEADWWRHFGSAELDRLVAKALRDNNDLAAAVQRVEQARAQAKIAAAPLLPTAGINAGANASHDRLGEQRSEALDLAVAYEVDLWGANRGKRDAGKALLKSQVLAKDALQLVLMAEISQGYFNLLATAERRRIAEQFLGNVDEVMSIVDARFQAGAVSALDLAQQRTERANAVANLNLLNQQTALAENGLAILLGSPISALNIMRENFETVLVPSIPAQQPSSLLQRRPDLRQLELQLQAANLDVGVARAQFYPKLQLNLDSVLASPQPAGFALNMAANLAQPLFQGGRLEGGLAQAKARQAELEEQYQQALLSAFKEVEDAAAVRNHSSLRVEALNDAVIRAREAYQISLDRYRVGSIDYQTLLNTQRSLLNAQTSQVQARLELLQALAQLYKALGGGWQS